MVKGKRRLSTILIWVLGSMLLASSAGSAPGQDPDGPKLRRAADAVLKLEDVQARGRVGEVFRYSDWLLEHGPKKEAVRYLKAGLKVHVWRLDQQIKLARALDDLGDKEGSARAAGIVAERGEEDSPVLDARLLLGLPIPDTKFETMEAGLDASPALVLLPLGETDPMLLVEVAGGLAKKLGIEVVLRQVDWSLPKPGRDPKAEYLEHLRKDIRERKAERDVKSALDRHQAGIQDLDFDEKLLAVARTWAESAEGPEGAARFDENIRMAALRRQWDAVPLREMVKARTGTFRKRGLAFLAVTRGDLYANDYNFVFAQAESAIGVLSYARFRAAFNDESPDRKRLVSRMLKQGLASAGHVFGLERCTNPACARAFPISLEEHDAKSEDACAECRAGFEQRFKSAR